MTLDYKGLMAGGREILSCIDEQGKPFAAAVGDAVTPAAMIAWPYNGDADDRRQVLELNRAGFSVPEFYRYRCIGKVLAVVVWDGGPRTVAQWGRKEDSDAPSD